MRNIAINGRTYTFEYSIEASLYEDCCGCIMDLFVGEGLAKGEAEAGNIKGAWAELKKSITDISKRALTLFYAGLMENHGDEIKDEEDAKALLKLYLAESGKNMLDVANELMEIVDEDNFFGLLGLDKVFQTESNTTKKSTKEKPGKNTSTEQ